MTAKVVKDMTDKTSKTIKAGPWFIRINRSTRAVQATSGDYWFPVKREEAAQLIFRKVG